jgi:hypothetical protein
MTLVTLRQLIRDVSAGIRVLQTRDGLGLSEDQITERARNIVTGLMGNYHIDIIEDGHTRPSLTTSSRSSSSRKADEDDLLDAPAASES